MEWPDFGEDWSPLWPAEVGGSTQMMFTPQGLQASEDAKASVAQAVMAAGLQPISAISMFIPPGYQYQPLPAPGPLPGPGPLPSDLLGRLGALEAAVNEIAAISGLSFILGLRR